uniref:Uncharacterized protein n=1 Tax=Oryza brachyantha TaxID=4533 RepID=J3N2I8_ORYBR
MPALRTLSSHLLHIRHRHPDIPGGGAAVLGLHDPSSGSLEPPMAGHPFSAALITTHECTFRLLHGDLLHTREAPKRRWRRGRKGRPPRQRQRQGVGAKDDQDRQRRRGRQELNPVPLRLQRRRRQEEGGRRHRRRRRAAQAHHRVRAKEGRQDGEASGDLEPAAPARQPGGAHPLGDIPGGILKAICSNFWLLPSLN